MDEQEIKQFLINNEIIFKEHSEVTLSHVEDGDIFLYSLKLDNRESPIQWKSMVSPDSTTTILEDYFLDLGLTFKK